MMPKKYREYLKANTWEEMEGIITDQKKGIPYPPVQQPHPEDAQLFDLVPPSEFTIGNAPLREIMTQRRSRRKFTDESLTLEELSFLLWATQGVRKVFRKGLATFRTVPSAGARHATETYLVINRVESLEPGLYRYLSLSHQLYRLRTDSNLPAQSAAACQDQIFVQDSAVTFIWTAIPYRMEWRYSIASTKLIALDAGHICQNLYLASESIGAGACAIAAYNQKKVDALLGVDGEDEFAIYVAPVGKIKA